MNSRSPEIDLKRIFLSIIAGFSPLKLQRIKITDPSIILPLVVLKLALRIDCITTCMHKSELSQIADIMTIIFGIDIGNQPYKDTPKKGVL